jgi:uncharacterized protein
MTYLADVNFWLALSFQRHVHHQSAKAWFEQAVDASCAFCRMTQQGFLRLATNPKAVEKDAVSMTDAWRLFDLLLNDPRVIYSEEPANIESLWRSYTLGATFSPKSWNDAFLAAFAQAAQFEVVTFDREFRKYGGVKCVVLS